MFCNTFQRMICNIITNINRTHLKIPYLYTIALPYCHTMFLICFLSELLFGKFAIIQYFCCKLSIKEDFKKQPFINKDILQTTCRQLKVNDVSFGDAYSIIYGTN